MDTYSVVLKRFLILLLILTTFAQFIVAWQKRTYATDHRGRWRECRYMMNGINVYDVASGKVPAISSIGGVGAAWGYPAWGMVSGIVMNYTYLSEYTARRAVLITVFLTLAFALYYAWRHGKAAGYDIETILLMCLCVAGIRSWHTTLIWANSGTIYAVMLFMVVLLEEKHPYPAGVLLSFAAAKPQMAALFCLVLLLRRRWKILFTAGAIVLAEWMFACAYTGTSPMRFLRQTLGNGFMYVDSGTASFIRNVFTTLGATASQSVYFWLGAVFGIGLTLYLYFSLPKDSDKLLVYAIPTVISTGIWSYCQPHDWTLFLCFLFTLFGFLHQKTGEPYKKFIWLCIMTIAVPQSIPASIIYKVMPASFDYTTVYNFITLIYQLIHIAGMFILVHSAAPGVMDLITKDKQPTRKRGVQYAK